MNAERQQRSDETSRGNRSAAEAPTNVEPPLRQAGSPSSGSRFQFSLRWIFGATALVAVGIGLIQQGFFACLLALILAAALSGAVGARRISGSAVLGGMVGGAFGGLVALLVGMASFYLGAAGTHTDEALVGGFLFTTFVHVAVGGAGGFGIGCGVAFAASVYDATRGSPVTTDPLSESSRDDAH